MSHPTVYVESEADERLAHVLLRSLPVTINHAHTSSGASSHAMTALMLRPEEPVAVLLSTRDDTPRQVALNRAIIERELLRWADSSSFFVAFAEKRPLDWVLTDPRLRQAFEDSPPDMKIYIDRANRAADLARTIPFDPSHLLRDNADYRGLVAFIHRHAAQPQAS